MKNCKGLIAIVLSVLLMACDSSKKGTQGFFSIDESVMKEQYVFDDSLQIIIKNLESKKVDSVVYFFNEKKLGTTKGLQKFNFLLPNQKLGYQYLKTNVFFENTIESDTTRIELVSNIEPKLLKYSIINTYPHDISSFTEGLEFYNDTLYEGTGQYKESKLLKTDYKTGKILKSLVLESKYFGEGITILNGKIYQLTYKEKTGFIYDLKTFKLEKSFVNDKLEGWGMTNDGKNIYLNDSSEKIWVMNPTNQTTFDFINVYTGCAKVKGVNELEWINGKIFANIFTKDAVAVINPATGAVESVIDLSALKKQIKNPNSDVLNGIAYNPKTKTIFVTGKNWDKMFEIRID